MRAWFRTLLLLAAAVALALWLRDHGGNVILAIPPWRIQFSTTLGALLLIALFVALHWLLRAWSWLGAVPTRLRHWRGQRAQQRDHDLFERGWVSLAEGDYAHAERDFSRLLAQTRVPRRKVMAALAAARAAHAQASHAQHAQSQTGRSQTFLNTAQDYMGHDPALQRAVAVTHADILLDSGQFDAALACLTGQPDGQNATASTQQPTPLSTQPLPPPRNNSLSRRPSEAVLGALRVVAVSAATAVLAGCAAKMEMGSQQAKTVATGAAAGANAQNANAQLEHCD